MEKILIKKLLFIHLEKNEILKLSGKDLSYNNICDLEIAVDLAHQFSNPACV